MISWRARTHQQCDSAPLLTYRTKQGKSGTRRSPGTNLGPSRFIIIDLTAAIDGKRPDDLVFTMPAALSCGCPTDGVPPSYRPVTAPRSVTVSGFTICGTPPRR